MKFSFRFLRRVCNSISISSTKNFLIIFQCLMGGLGPRLLNFICLEMLQVFLFVRHFCFALTLAKKFVIIFLNFFFVFVSPVRTHALNFNEKVLILQLQ